MTGREETFHRRPPRGSFRGWRPAFPILRAGAHLIPATDREFRYRFWWFSLLYLIGFSCYLLDPVNAGVALARGLADAVTAIAAPRDSILHAVFGVGAALALAAAALRTWAAAYLDSAVVHDAALHAEQVVADGPYRFVRNPLYLGSLLLAAGMGVLASRLGWLVLSAGTLGLVVRLVAREEAELEASQGAAYRRYRTAVPRLLPALAPRVPASGARPRWGSALLGESFTWIFALATVAFAVALRFEPFLVLVAAGFVLHVAYDRWLARRQAGAQRRDARR